MSIVKRTCDKTVLVTGASTFPRDTFVQHEGHRLSTLNSATKFSVASTQIDSLFRQMLRGEHVAGLLLLPSGRRLRGTRLNEVGSGVLMDRGSNQQRSTRCRTNGQLCYQITGRQKLAHQMVGQ
jgi:hypothetical protein